MWVDGLDPQPESWAGGRLTTLAQERKATICVEFISGTEAREGGLLGRLRLSERHNFHAQF